MTAIEQQQREPDRWVCAPAPWSHGLNSAGAALASLCAAGLRNLFGPRDAGQFGILMYHRCSPRVPGVPRPAINVTPRRFRRQLEGLLRYGYRFWSLPQVLEAAAQGTALPPHVVVLTFDDGYENVYIHAARILRDLQIPATIFVNTAYLDSQAPFPFDHWGMAYHHHAPAVSYRPLTIEQCQELAEDPLFDIGAHTHTHEDFRQRPADFFRDLELNVQLLRKHFGVERPSFAFPYGTPYLGFADPALASAARSVGVACGLTTGSTLVDVHADPFTWGRLHVFGWDTAQTIDARLSGWYSWAPRQRQRLAQWLRCTPRTSKAAGEGQVPALTMPPSSPASAAPRGLAASSRRGSAEPAGRPLISVVMPTFNRADWVGGALQSLFAQQTDDRFDYEVIVVDNASSDNTAAIVAAHQSGAPIPVQYVLERKPGDAPTRNAGIRQARGQWIAFFDDDQFADPRWLAELYRAAVTTGAPVIGGPVLLDLTAEQLEWLGPLCRRALREIRLYKYLAPYNPKQLPGTGNALVARNLFELLGAFDEAMKTGGSDSDFFKRVREAGYELWYAPAAVIRHRVPAERLTREYLRWDALSGGAGHAAHFDHRDKGTLALCTLCAARLAQALLVNGPLYLADRLRGKEGRALGRLTLLWRTEGYLRKTLAVLAPRLCAQHAFFASLEFRRGRTLGVAADAKETAPAATPLVPSSEGVAE